MSLRTRWEWSHQVEGTKSDSEALIKSQLLILQPKMEDALPGKKVGSKTMLELSAFGCLWKDAYRAGSSEQATQGVNCDRNMAPGQKSGTLTSRSIAFVTTADSGERRKT